MLKTSANISDIRKAYNALKNNTNYFRRAVSAPMLTGGTLPTGKGGVAIGINQDLLRLSSPRYIKELGKAGIPSIPGVYLKGDQYKFIKNVPGISMPSLTGHNKEMFNRVIGLHEGWEANQPIRRIMDAVKSRIGSHIDPEILLRESNVVSTLPSRYSKVKDSLSSMRNLEGTKQYMESAVPGFTYGKTRLSRHGRKRVANILRRKIEESSRDLLGDQYDEVMKATVDAF